MCKNLNLQKKIKIFIRYKISRIKTINNKIFNNHKCDV